MRIIDDYCVFDLETSIRNVGEMAVGKFKASPHSKANQIVMLGMKMGKREEIATITYPTLDKAPSAVAALYVGQNIKFDLLYMLHRTDYWVDIVGQVKIWDTMIAEYLLTAQRSQFISLDKLATKYGGTLKDDRIKDFWEAGVDTEEIPEDMLEEYLKDDVINTEIVYLAQRKEAERLGMLPLIESQMDAMLMTTIMEYNGMRFDVPLARERAKELRIEFDKRRLAMNEKLEGIMDVEGVNCLSNQQLSCALFGGIYKYVTDVVQYDEEGEPITYKSGIKQGEVKTRKEKIEKKVKGLAITPKPDMMKTGFYQVADKTLSKYDHPICAEMVKLREMSKSLGTYYEGYLDLVWPSLKIHGVLNHCSTITGRLSSTAPNLQNISNKEDD